MPSKPSKSKPAAPKRPPTEVEEHHLEGPNGTLIIEKTSTPGRALLQVNLVVDKELAQLIEARLLKRIH